MPLQTRVVEPVRITRYTVWQAGESSGSPGTTSSPLNELEAVTNGTCANIICQLSSLSKHAEEMFGELTRESHSLVARVNSLKIRLNKLSAGVKELDSTDEKGRCYKLQYVVIFYRCTVYTLQQLAVLNLWSRVHGANNWFALDVI